MIQNQGFLITCCYSYVTILSPEKVDFPPSVNLSHLVTFGLWLGNNAQMIVHVYQPDIPLVEGMIPLPN